MAILTYVRYSLPCKSGPVPASVSIVGCSSVPCNLVRGTNVEGRINFKAGKQRSKLCLLKMPVEKSYPKVALTIQLSLVDENNNAEVCFRIPAKVVD